MMKEGKTLQEMGDEFGVTRERVRQQISRLFPNDNRLKMRRENRLWENAEAKYLAREARLLKHPLLSALRKKCEEEGIQFEYYSNIYYAFLNGIKCRVKRGYRMCDGNDRYMRVGEFGETLLADVAITIHRDPVNLDDWWIFPRNIMPDTSSFTREETPSDYYREPRYSMYLKYKNAWHLLKEDHNASGTRPRSKPKV